MSVLSVFSQELNCNVQVNSDQVQGTNKNVFNALQRAVNDFVNNQRWTDLAYTASERIECNITIIVKSAEGDNFTAELLVQSRRPVFNSSYTTSILNMRDVNFAFTFREFDQLENVSGTLTSNLTAVLSYYAYLIIGYDMDTYSRKGGTPAFQMAESIVTAAQSSDWSGWRAFEDNKNRYAVINNLLDEAFSKFRGYMYDYHRLGLDIMAENATNGRAKIAEGLPLLREANRARPSSIILTVFMDTKNDEIINIFKGGTDKEKINAVEILSDVNPASSTRYETIMQKK
ncbi:MAG: DUF4835 family protein [Prevotellaceae bacterium]|nr:DUF4835 family protein [Prevotellaceae bacterium]